MVEEPENFITYELQDGRATLTLNRPPLNVLNIAMLRQLEAAISTLEGDKSVRLLVLQAEGKFFSAGVDVADHTAEKVGEMIPLFDHVCRALAEFPTPTLAVVHGHALGGGCELVLCCDLAVMVAGAKIGQPEIKLGAIAPIAALRLPLFVGYRTAADMLFSGSTLNAQEAYQAGLVNAVVPSEQLSSWVQEKALQLLELSGAALRFTKRALQLGFNNWADGLEELDRIYLQELMSTADSQEGLAAFLEKRYPVWKHE